MYFQKSLATRLSGFIKKDRGPRLTFPLSVNISYIDFESIVLRHTHNCANTLTRKHTYLYALSIFVCARTYIYVCAHMCDYMCERAFEWYASDL